MTIPEGEGIQQHVDKLIELSSRQLGNQHEVNNQRTAKRDGRRGGLETQ